MGSNQYNRKSDLGLNLQNYRVNFSPIIKITKENSKFFHFYYNDDTEEVNKKEFFEFLVIPKSVTKMKIIIDSHIKSFVGLFKGCSIERINFIKFKRNNIYDMSEMFYECKQLKKLILSILKLIT